MTARPDRRRTLLSGLGRWVLVLTGLYVAAGVLLAIFQRRLQYFPVVSDPPLPATPDFDGIEDVTLRAEDGTRLRAWYWPGARSPTVLMFHGNGGNRYHRQLWMRDIHELGYGVFVLDYRGYGGSGGSPSEEGLYADARAACAWLEERVDARIVYYGESLGSGVAIETALHRPPAGVVIQGGFSSVTEVAQRSYPVFPVGLVLRDRYENSAKIGRLSCPVLIVHGDRDSIIPVDLARKLHSAAGAGAELWIVPGADHNDLPDVGGREYLRRLDAFLERCAAGGS